MKPRIAILGAGNGAHAFAGDLALRGHPVRIYSKFADEISSLQAAGGITCEGAVEGFGAIELASTDMAPVIADADFIFVVLPATVHAFMAETCAPHLRDHQIIVLHPGRTGGALEFRHVLERLHSAARVMIAETQTLLYACRLSAPTCIRIGGVKKQVTLAAYPTRDTPTVLERINPLFPQFVAGSDVLETGLGNVGAVFHPAGTILSASRIESGVPFEFWHDMTPGVAHALEVVDQERLAVACAYGVKAETACEWMARSYAGVRGDTLYDHIQSNAAYRGIVAPRSLDVRYLWEDVPTGLVPMVALGRAAEVQMPLCTGLVDLAGALLDRDFWEEGRNARRLAIEGLNVAQIKAMVRG